MYIGGSSLGFSDTGSRGKRSHSYSGGAEGLAQSTALLKGQGEYLHIWLRKYSYCQGGYSKKTSIWTTHFSFLEYVNEARKESNDKLNGLTDIVQED